MHPTLAYLETCQPDYFPGSDGAVIAVDAIGRVRDVLAALRQEIDATWDYWAWIPAQQRYATPEETDEIDKEIRRLFRGMNRSESWARLNRREHDGAQAYFCIYWGG